jgi:outer membrane biosynthesis protein TonB
MQKKIALFVTSVHLLLIFLFCFSPIKKPISPKKHIAVRTLQPKTRTSSAVVPRTSTSKGGGSSTFAAPKPKLIKKEGVKKESPQPKAAPPGKTTAPAKTAPIKSKPIHQKKPAMIEKGKPKKTPKAPDKVWKEIDEALAKIDDKVYSKRQSKLDVPTMKGISPLSLPFGEVDEGEGTEEEALGSFLTSSLKLPEFGEVKIQLTIKKDGSVARLVVVQTESRKNKDYLEKHLPLLRFPLILDKEKTFTLTFCNEI